MSNLEELKLESDLDTTEEDFYAQTARFKEEQGTNVATWATKNIIGGRDKLRAMGYHKLAASFLDIITEWDR